MQIKDLTGGVVRTISPDALQSNQVQDAQNVTFTEMPGVVKTRRGYSRYGSILYKYANSIFWQNIFATTGIVAFGGRVDELTPNVLTVTDGYPNSDAPVLWLHDRVVPYRLSITSRDYSAGGGGGGQLSLSYSADNASFLEYGNWLLFCDGNENYMIKDEMGCEPLIVWTFFWEWATVVTVWATNGAGNYGIFIWAASTGDPETEEFWCCFEWEKQQIEGDTPEDSEDACTSAIDLELASDPRSLSYPCPIGIAAPTGTINAATGAAGNPNGTYTWKVTYVDNAGFESNGDAESGSLSPASEQVALTNIPISNDAHTVARRIYRNENGGATWKRVGEISNNYETTYTDNVADASLGASMPEVNGMPPPFVALTTHNSRVWGIRAAYPDEVWYCNAKSDWQYFDTNNYEEFGVVPKNTRALVSIGSYLVILQSVDVYLYNTAEQPAVISKALLEHGIATNRAAFDIGSGVLIGNIIGVYEFGIGNASELTQAIKPIFDKSSDDSLRINETYITNMRVVSDGDNILVSYTRTGQTANDRTLWIKRKGSVVEGIIPVGFIDFAVDKELRDLYGLTSDYKVYKIFSGDDDDGTDIDWYFQTQDYALEYKSAVSAKEGVRVKVDCNPNGGTITVEIYLDGSVAQTRTLTGAARTEFRWRLPDQIFHRISYRLSGSGKQYFYSLTDNISEGGI